MFKLGIIIPLKAKAVSKDWTLVERNLFATLRAISIQTDSDFKVAIVGHDKPSVSQLDTNEQVSFYDCSRIPPPKVKKLKGDALNQAYENDRVRKIQDGIIYLYDTCSHFFVLDADDLISCDFVAEIKKNRRADAIVFRRGYNLYADKVCFENNLDEYCGSTCCVQKKLVFVDSGECSITLEISDKLISIFKLVSHVAMKRYLVSKDLNVYTPRKRLVSYVRENGENISGFNLNNFTSRRKLLKRLIAIRVRWLFTSAEKFKKQFPTFNFSDYS